MHSKVKELQLRATGANYSNMAVNDKGVIVEERTIKGYLATWGVTDTYGTRFIKGCFSRSISERGPDSNAKQKIVYLWQHDMRDPIGRFTRLEEDEYGLYFEAEIDDVPSGNRALRQVASGTINQNSFGFDYVWDKVEYDDKTDSINVMEVILYEGSAVTIGSNSETYMFRSPEDVTNAKEVLTEETEDFARTLTHKQRYEMKQLITRHISIAKAETQSIAIRQPEQKNAVDIDYKLLTDNFKL